MALSTPGSIALATRSARARRSPGFMPPVLARAVSWLAALSWSRSAGGTLNWSKSRSSSVFSPSLFSREMTTDSSRASSPFPFPSSDWPRADNGHNATAAAATIRAG